MPFPPVLKALGKLVMKAFLHSATAVALYVLRVVSLACMLSGTLTKVLLAWLLSWQCKRCVKKLLSCRQKSVGKQLGKGWAGGESQT